MNNEQLLLKALSAGLPDVSDDFSTMLETQKISERVKIKLANGVKDKITDSNEVLACFVVRNGIMQWSLDECGTSQYYKLEIAEGWQPYHPHREESYFVS